ncbi:MAG: VCBS repeat-containing protein, partial [Bacteroidota bacterium]
LEDFFIGGAKGQAGRIFVQGENGTFIGTPLPTGKESEDVGAVFFDADRDGDLDLYVCSGSTEFPLDSEHYKDRLYMNNGRGQFLDASQDLPNKIINSACAAAADFDNDGDVDLFIGCKVEPGNYIPQSSYLLENQNGNFYDVTDEVAPQLSHLGGITDALWTDMDQDGYMDLWISGEWLPLTLFKNDKGALKDLTRASGLEKTVGLWNTIAAYDVDQDGDTDLIAGNLGLNTPYRTSSENPFSRFIDDFDENGHTDVLMAHYVQGEQVPFHFRDDLLNRLQPLKKTFPDYKSYATASWDDVLKGTARAISQGMDTFATSWLENRGDGGFRIHALPKEAQFSPVHAILAHDFNNDNHTDLLLTGNSKEHNPFAGYFDAMQGVLLLGDENNRFTATTMEQSGFYVPGEGRALELLDGTNSKPKVLAAQNNGALQTFVFEKGDAAVSKEK